MLGYQQDKPAHLTVIHHLFSTNIKTHAKIQTLLYFLTLILFYNCLKCLVNVNNLAFLFKLTSEVAVLLLVRLAQ